MMPAGHKPSLGVSLDEAVSKVNVQASVLGSN